MCEERLATKTLSMHNIGLIFRKTDIINSYTQQKITWIAPVKSNRNANHIHVHCECAIVLVLLCCVYICFVH